MTWLPAAKILFFCFLSVIFSQGCWSKSLPRVNCTDLDCAVNINCLVINLEYVDCNWTTTQKPEMNYTFSSLFQGQRSYQECSEYRQEHSHNIGCRIPLESRDQRFVSLSTKLYLGSNQSIFKNYTTLQTRVKLNPPYNVSVKWKSQNELCLHWVNSVNMSCVASKVRSKRGSSPWQTITSNLVSSPHCIPLVSKIVDYTFQVSSNIKAECGPSDFWSEWSDPVEWGRNKESSQASLWKVLVSVFGGVLLVALTVLLCYCERIKVVLLPVVPDPTKNLQNLFQKYNGNVESWVHVSKELKEAFEPDYTDAPCAVYDPNPAIEPSSLDGPMEQPSS